MVFLYFIFLAIGASIISILFLKDTGRKQHTADKELIIGINKISKRIDDWEKHLDYFLIKRFQKSVVATKIENPFSNSKEEKIDDTLKEKSYASNLDSSEEKYLPKNLDSAVVRAQEHAVRTDEASDWQTKYERIEILFFEKSTLLEKLEKSFENEIKNRKEFSLLKDILEEQIEKAKERNRHLQSELSSLRNENEEYKTKIIQLENQILQNHKIIQEQETRVQ